MTPVQIQAYDEIVARARSQERGPMLETLHLLRSISLHPTWPPAGEVTDESDFIAQSARLAETFSILDEIARRREKVLIFLESLQLQDHLAAIIKRRYGLSWRPMQINGEIAGEKRQRLVDEFQKNSTSFDAMILSPRAGGVGLTLTSANHVIHLSRWWNPAVEDQCTDRVYRIGQTKEVHVYYPMAMHPVHGDGSFDGLLNDLLETKRRLSARMLVPPVNLKRDQEWFSDHLRGTAKEPPIEPVDVDDIDRLDPKAFERWALSRCVVLGWEVSATPSSYDGGADGFLVHRHTGARAIVQCKHKQVTTQACGSEAIDDLLRARANYNETARLFALTNAQNFTASACDQAARHGVILISRQGLATWPRQVLQA